MANFARELLLKYGWSEGKGLGKHENGITEPLKPEVKLNTKGIGFADSEFKWWEFVYNKASNNLKIQNTVKDTKIDVSDKNAVIIKSTKEQVNLELMRKSHPDSLLYGNFLKTSTLTDGKFIKDQNFNENIMSTIKENQNTALSLVLKDEELYKACRGRTAHKGARHGLNLNGKLARLKQQDEEFLRKMTSQNPSTYAVKNEITEGSNDKKKKKKKKKEKNNENIKYVQEEIIDTSETAESLKIDIDCMKKSKKSSENITLNLADLENQISTSLVLSSDVSCEKALKKTKKLSENVTEVDTDGFIPVKSKKSKKKVKQSSGESTKEIMEISVDISTDFPPEKKRQKKRKLQNNVQEKVVEESTPVERLNLNFDADIESNDENLLAQKLLRTPSKKMKMKRKRGVENLTHQLATSLELSDTIKPKKNKRKIQDVNMDVVEDVVVVKKKSKKEKKKLNIVISADEAVDETQTEPILKQLRAELTEAYKLNNRIAKKKKNKFERKEKKRRKLSESIKEY